MGVLGAIGSRVENRRDRPVSNSNEAEVSRSGLITQIDSYLSKLDKRTLKVSVPGYAGRNYDIKWLCQGLNKSVVINFDYRDGNQLKVRLRACELSDTVSETYFDQWYGNVAEAINGITAFKILFDSLVKVPTNR